MIGSAQPQQDRQTELQTVGANQFLINAIEQDDPEQVMYAISNGANLSYPCERQYISSIDNQYDIWLTPLYFAAKHNKFQALQTLLNSRATILPKGDTVLTLLEWACYHQNLPMAIYLLAIPEIRRSSNLGLQLAVRNNRLLAEALRRSNYNRVVYLFTFPEVFHGACSALVDNGSTIDEIYTRFSFLQPQNNSLTPELFKAFFVEQLLDYNQFIPENFYGQMNDLDLDTLMRLRDDLNLGQLDVEDQALVELNSELIRRFILLSVRCFGKNWWVMHNQSVADEGEHYDNYIHFAYELAYKMLTVFPDKIQEILNELIILKTAVQQVSHYLPSTGRTPENSDSDTAPDSDPDPDLMQIETDNNHSNLKRFFN